MDPNHQSGTSQGQTPPDGEGPSPECPNDARLESLLEADEDSAENRWFVAHLEACPHCPDRLNTLWSRMTDANRTPVPVQLDRDQFNRILDRIHAKTTASQFDLSFLPVSVRAGCLGRLGPYDLERVIGSGGMGLVFKGWDHRTGERVAVKTLRRPREAGADLRERFLREGSVARPVRHPGVLPVQDSGTDAGVPYLVTPLLTGRSFDNLIHNQAPLPVADAVEWIRQAAEALGAAHRLNIVHRDIKPSNLWLRREGEAGRVRVIDFGLALAESQGDRVRLTTAGTMLGTPAYIAPEQAAGEPSGPPADVFSLGCVLYEMLTGRRVFPGDNPLEVMRSIAAFRVIPAGRFRPDLPRPLRDILTRCLELDPANRYPDASTLAEELRRLQTGLKSLYRPPGRTERLRRWALRHPGYAVTFGLVALVLTTATVVSLHLAREAGRARAIAETEVETSRRVAEKNSHLLYFAGIRAAVNSYLSGRVGEARASLTEMENTLEFNRLAGFEWRHLADLCSRGAQEMPISPEDNSLVARGITEMAPGVLAALTNDSFVRIDWRHGECARFPVEIRKDFLGLPSLSPDGRQGAWLTPGGVMTLIDLETGSESEICQGLKLGNAVVQSLALGPVKSNRLFIALRDPTGNKHSLVTWDLARGEATHTQGLEWKPGRQFLSSPDGGTLLGLLEGGRLVAWNPSRPGPPRFAGPLPIESPVPAWRADGTDCYVMGRENFRTRVYFWDLAGSPEPVDFGTAQPDLMAPATNGDFFTFDSTGAMHRLDGNRATRVPGGIAVGVYSRALITSDSRFPLKAVAFRGTALQTALVPPDPMQRHTIAGPAPLADVVWLDDSHLVARQTMGKDGFTHLTVLRSAGGVETVAPPLTVRRETRLQGRCMIAPSAGTGKVLVVRDRDCLWLDATGETDTGIRLEKSPFKLVALGDGFAGLSRDGTLFRLDGSLRAQWSLVVPGSGQGPGELLGFSAAPDSSSLAVLWRSSGKATLSWVRASDGMLLSTEIRENWGEVLDMSMVSPEELALARLTGDVFLHSLPRQTTLATGKNMDRIPVYMDYSKAAGRMATIDTGGQIHLWDPRQWLHVPIVSNPRENRSSIPLSLAFSPGGDRLSFFTEDGTVSVLAAPQPGKP